MKVSRGVAGVGFALGVTLAVLPAVPALADMAGLSDWERRLFHHADRDGDGKVSREEFIVDMRALFKDADGDGDGFVYASEIRAVKPDAFARIDADRDGRITIDEAVAAKLAEFKQMDADRDGALSLQELTIRIRPAAEAPHS